MNPVLIADSALAFIQLGLEIMAIVRPAIEEKRDLTDDEVSAVRAKRREVSADFVQRWS